MSIRRVIIRDSLALPVILTMKYYLHACFTIFFLHPYPRFHCYSNKKGNYRVDKLLDPVNDHAQLDVHFQLNIDLINNIQGVSNVSSDNFDNAFIYGTLNIQGSQVCLSNPCRKASRIFSNHRI